MIKDITPPLLKRKNEFYALDMDEYGCPRGVGPFSTLGELESNLPPGEYTIVTKLKQVVVS